MYHFTAYVFLLPVIYVLLNVVKQLYKLEEYEKQYERQRMHTNNLDIKILHSNESDKKNIYESLQSDKDTLYMIAFLYINLCISSILVHNDTTMKKLNQTKLKCYVVKYDDLMIFLVNFYLLVCIVKLKSVIKKNRNIIGLGILISCCFDLKFLKKSITGLSQFILCFMQPIYVSIITNINLLLYLFKEKYLDGKWIKLHRLLWHFIIAIHSLYVINNILM